MPDTTTPLPSIGSRCWRDRISPETGAIVLNVATEFSDSDPQLAPAL